MGFRNSAIPLACPYLPVRYFPAGTYDGHLYTVIKGSYVTEAPAWIVFGDGSCQSPVYSVCGSSTDLGVAGNVKVKGLRAFEK